MDKKNILVLGGGGFIGGHLAKRMKNEGHFVRVVDVKDKPSFFNEKDICDQYISLDLSYIYDAKLAFEGRYFHEVYNLAADMGGAGYIFTGDNDYKVMSNSVRINLNVIESISKLNCGRVFFSSSACVYPEHNQMDPNNPTTEESTAYPANPDSEYGWEKLFSERLYLAAQRNKGIVIRIGRYHNVFGPYCSWNDGKEKAPAAMCRKVAENDQEIDVWGDGEQTRSFLYIDDALDATILMMRQDNFCGPLNIGSEEMVSINGLANAAMHVAGKHLKINHIQGPLGVRGRNSHNKLISKSLGWRPNYSLVDGLKPTYEWIKNQVS
jgi:GDP-D-mannose 3',5'-epimerase